MSVQKSIHKYVVSIFTMVALAAFSTSAMSQQRPDYGTPVDSAAAKRIGAAIIEACRAENWNVAVAVVDTHGFLVYFERMDNTQTASVEIAQRKASTAATFRRSTRVFADAIGKGRTALVTFPVIVASPGGLPILKDGKVIGGVGVSGVTGAQDEQCAKAGLEAL